MQTITTTALPTDQTVESRGSTRVRVFGSGVELFYLAVPFAFITFLIADLLFLDILTGRPFDRQILALITSALFLNNLHVYFTFSFLLKVPELKAWIDEETGGRPWRFWAELVGIGVLVFGLLLISNKHLGVHWRVYFLVAIVLMMLPVHHTIAQMFGLSMLYNRRIAEANNYDEDQARRAAECARYERWGFNVLLVSYVGTITAVGISTMLFAGNVLPGWFGKALWLGVLASVLFILVNSLRYPCVLGSNKPLFLSRLLLFPLVPVLPFAYAAISACHGTEYLAVATKVRERSAMRGAARTQFTYTVLALCALGLGLLLCRADQGIVNLVMDGGYRAAPRWMHALAYASITIAFVHYYLDRRIFRFRKASCRRHVLPLLD